jgi:hypothetical protein
VALVLIVHASRLRHAAACRYEATDGRDDDGDDETSPVDDRLVGHRLQSRDGGRAGYPSLRAGILNYDNAARLHVTPTGAASLS